MSIFLFSKWFIPTLSNRSNFNRKGNLRIYRQAKKSCFNAYCTVIKSSYTAIVDNRLISSRIEKKLISINFIFLVWTKIELQR